MEELGIHRIGIKQKDNVVDVYMNSDATEEINDYLHQNIENFDTMAVRVHVDDPEMDFVTAKTVSIDISAYATDEVSIDEEEMLQAISALDESFQNGDVVVGGICYFMPAAAPETVIALGFV